MDPLKTALESINEELEDAMNRLNETNRRVDELLSEFGPDDAPARAEQASGTETATTEAAETHDDAEEPPAEL